MMQEHYRYALNVKTIINIFVNKHNYGRGSNGNVTKQWRDLAIVNADL